MAEPSYLDVTWRRLLVAGRDTTAALGTWTTTLRIKTSQQRRQLRKHAKIKRWRIQVAAGAVSLVTNALLIRKFWRLGCAASRDSQGLDVFDLLDVLVESFAVFLQFLHVLLGRLVSLVVSSVLVAPRSLPVRHGRYLNGFFFVVVFLFFCCPGVRKLNHPTSSQSNVSLSPRERHASRLLSEQNIPLEQRHFLCGRVGS